MQNITVGLVGNPNCGKTTLFNALTGSRQRVGNWPGVTVQRKTGCFTVTTPRLAAETVAMGVSKGGEAQLSPFGRPRGSTPRGRYNWAQREGTQIEVVDLPGVYSLASISDSESIDTRIACDFMRSSDVDVVVNVVDASNLERNLYLTAQLLEMRVPLVVALNMMDLAESRRHFIDVKALSQRLGCPVVPLQSRKGKGIHRLKATILHACRDLNISPVRTPFPEVIEDALNAVVTRIGKVMPQQRKHARHLAMLLLEGDRNVCDAVDSSVRSVADEQGARVESRLEEDADILMADHRYSFVHAITQAVLERSSERAHRVTSIVDRIVLNRVLGIPIFLGIMYLMFLFAINVGGAFQDFFDISTNAIFVQGVAHVLTVWHVPGWITAIIATGAGKGLNTVLTFIPVIGGMFLFLSFLEDSGYMARAAFVMDRCMRVLGLPGKSFVPMIVGFGCNVPAIMATRTLENRRDRVMTIMMSPFMSCGARLAIFAVFTAAFFPVGGQNIVFALYLIGIAVAVLTGLILKKTVLRGKPSSFILELPPYHMPSLRSILLQTWVRLKTFLFKAGKVIVPACVLIGALNALTIHGDLVTASASQQSLLSIFGRGLTPLFAPMGIHQNNWPATVGLMTGSLAKEVIIATLNTLYTEVGHLAAATQHFNLWGNLHAALLSIPENIKALPRALGNPLLASVPEHSVNSGVYGVMSQRFGGQAAAFSYLLFILLYIPCVSTTAVMMRELNRAWGIFSIFWSVSLAYMVAVIFYQSVTFVAHPLFSTLWIAGLIALFFMTIGVMKHYADKGRARP